MGYTDLLTGAASSYLTGGLGGSGGVGGEIPGNSASSSAAQNVRIDPNNQAKQDGTFQPQLNVAFPGANITPPGSVNAPSLLGFLPQLSPLLIVAGAGLLLLLFAMFRR